MKTIAVGFEVIVRMVILAAMLAVLASRERGMQKLAKASARARR
jgi:hypothetical protein